MALNFGAVFGIVWPKVEAQMPSAALIFRSTLNPTIPPHNPMREMVIACSKAWCNVLTTTPVTNTYVGVAGGTNTPSPAFLLFPASGGMGGALIGLMGWVGPYAVTVANALTTDIGLASAQAAQYVASPVPGGGAGTGTILPNNQASLASLAGVFYAALKAEFMAKRYFTVMDSGTVLTPQIEILLGALSGLYATMFASVVTVSPITYAGPTTTSPLSVPAAMGKIV